MPFIFTVLLFMLSLYSAVEKGSFWRYWAAGLLLGCGGDGKGPGSAVSAVLLVYLIFALKSMSDRVKMALGSRYSASEC